MKRTLHIIILLAVIAAFVPVQVEAQECDKPNVFSPPVAKSKWHRKRTKLWVTAQGEPDHRAYDLVVAQGDAQVLVGKFTYGSFHKDLKKEEVELFIQSEAPCGPWVSYGTVLTSKDGQHGKINGMEDDGGRAYFSLSAAQARPPGRYPAVMLVKGDHSRVEFTLFVVRPGTPAVVFDIDATLTSSDGEVFRQAVGRASGKDYDPDPRPGARDVARLWASMGYLVVYLTGRPDFLCGLSRQWLEDRGFPPGALFCTSKGSQVLPNNDGVGAFKTDRLEMLKDKGLVFNAAYGNAPTDIFAYRNAGIAKDSTFIIGPHAGKGGTVPLSSYTEHLPSLKNIPAVQIESSPP